MNFMITLLATTRKIAQMFKHIFSRRSKHPECPVCGCCNFTEAPFEGRVDQGVIGYDRKFSCGFATHWRGYRLELCLADNPTSRTLKAVANHINGVARA
jgi:hypothetical protein